MDFFCFQMKWELCNYGLTFPAGGNKYKKINIENIIKPRWRSFYKYFKN